MNQPSTSEKPETPNPRYVLEMLGFSKAEKALLASTFRLIRRRVFFHAEPTAPEDRPDIYLVNADNPEALNQLQTRAPNIHTPAVLIGRNKTSFEWPMVERPIHWTRLLDQLDTTMQTAMTERARRRGASKWDGSTYRRAADRDAPPRLMLIEPQTAESVLVVDDSATVRAFMRAKLAPFHFDVDYAENGEKAVDMVQAKAYTCVFLDILMPGMDGYQVCKRIKSSPATKDTSVIMLSSKSSAFDKFRGNWAGCDAYLSKPVGEGELLATILRFLPSARDTRNRFLTQV